MFRRSLVPVFLVAALSACYQPASDAGMTIGKADAPSDQSASGLPVIGATLPSIAGVTLDGEVIDNQTLFGKTVLINLWFFH